MEVSSQRGVTLIELAISLSLFVISLLAVAKMQIQTFGMDQITNLRNIAISEVNSLAEVILSDAHKPLTTEEMAAFEVNVASRLPLGLAKVEHSKNDYTIEVSWYTDGPTKHSDCRLIDNPKRQCVHVKVKG